MARHHPIARVLVVVGALALVAGCSDDGETTTASGLVMPSSTTEVLEPDESSETTEAATTTSEVATTTTTAPTTTAGVSRSEVTDAACATFAGTLIAPIGTEVPEDDAGFTGALEALVADGTEPAAGAAAALLALQQADSDAEDGDTDLTPAEASVLLEEGYAGLGVLHQWALDTCPTEGVVWSCAVTTGASTFTKVGEPIGGPDGVTTTTTEPGAATPEDVYAEAESDGDPVEVSRTDDEVVVAWLDDRGHAVEVLTAVDDGGWRSDSIETCDDDGNPVDMTPVPSS